MTIGQRIKALRIDLGLSQQEFSQKIGIGQAALSAIEKGIRNVTDRNIDLICSQYHVQEPWLREGEGPKEADSSRDIIADLSKKYNLNPFEEEFLHVFFALSPAQQKTVMDFAKFLYTQRDKELSANDFINSYRKLNRDSEIAEETFIDTKSGSHKTAV